MGILGVVRPAGRDLAALVIAVILPVAIVEVTKWIARARHGHERSVRPA